jgi:GNAT superfamily N-acetyltransferase
LSAPPSERGGLALARVTGDALVPWLGELARLRIRVFRDWPYLYDGDHDYEERYLRTYVETPDAVLVLALEGERAVGAATALPLAHETENVIAPLRAAGYDPRRVFYFGESVLLPGYRGRGIGVAFFEHREAHARGYGHYRHACFCGVVRPLDHPRRPADDVPLDGYWRRRGYAPVPGAVARFSWKDIDEPVESEKPLAFWVKAL